MRIDVLAPAKINLTLHVTGQRADGYHLLDSLVAFAPVGDHVSVSAQDDLSLAVTGPEASGVPTDMANLVMKTAALFAPLHAGIELTKNLPAASGIGGGSADAAATFRAMRILHEGKAEEAERGLLDLGADIPMCVSSRPARVSGIGERIVPCDMPSLPAVLVNPRVEVSTPEIFKALQKRDNPPMPEALPTFQDASGFVEWLMTMRNDLQSPAIAIAPKIADVLGALDEFGDCTLARMSGSGATCFGIFPTEQSAKAAQRTLSEAQPDWWVKDCVLGDQQVAAQPVVS